MLCSLLGVGFDLNRHDPSTRPAIVSSALRYHLRHASPSARTGSTAQVFVEPTLALTNIGVRPWAMSPRITVARSFASKANGSLSASPSSRVGIRRRFAPSPAIFAAFCTEEWVYTCTGGVRVFEYSGRRGKQTTSNDRRGGVGGEDGPTFGVAVVCTVSGSTYRALSIASLTKRGRPRTIVIRTRHAAHRACVRRLLTHKTRCDGPQVTLSREAHTPRVECSRAPPHPSGFRSCANRVNASQNPSLKAPYSSACLANVCCTAIPQKPTSWRYTATWPHHHSGNKRRWQPRTG